MSAERHELVELKKCRYCRDITLDKLASKNGFLHAPSRNRLLKSAQRCRLCSLLFRKDRSRERSAQLVLSLDKFGDDDEQIVLNVSHLVAGRVERKSRLLLFLYTNAGDPASVEFGITAKRSLSNTRSKETFSIIQKWLVDCTAQHDCMNPLPLRDQDGVQAARLLDLEAFKSSSLDVRLIDNDGRPKKYVALSYCWGEVKSFITTINTLKERQTRIIHSSLPKTFRDAIEIARGLELRYLWIDACCIIQDCLADWQRESTKMGTIYSNAFVTIAADSGTDSNSGCFNVKSTSQELAQENAPFELRSATSNGHKSSVFLWDPSRGARRPTPPEVDDSPLSERGWVCQERILSSRILHYTKSQLFWECRHSLLAEDGLRPWSLWSDADTVPGLARNLYGTTADTFSRNRLLDVWYQNVIAQSYSRRKLTRPGDKLTAISGIARAFWRHFRCQYIAGMWQLDLPFALCWRRRGTVARPKEYRAPSFSWASVDAIIEWPLRASVINVEVVVDKIRIQHISDDRFGPVESCSIQLTGRLRHAMVTVRKTITTGGFKMSWELRTLSNKLLGTAYMDSDDLDDGSERVECLILSEDEKCQALILDRISEVEQVYTRKGVVELLGLDKDDAFFDKGRTECITIV